MARPQKEGLDYFPHDTDAVNDEKIEALRAMFGNDGYAFYFILLERIYRTPEFELIINDNMIKVLAKKVGVSQKKFLKMIDFSLEIKIFCGKSYSGKRALTSEGIKKRASKIVTERQKAREKYERKKKISQQKIGGEIQEETREETRQETGESKVKESKIKEKENIYPSNDMLDINTHTYTTNVDGSGNKSVCVSAKEFQNKKGRPISPVELEFFEEAEEIRGRDLVLEALEIAFCQKKNPGVGYVRGILENWARDGLHDIEDVRLAEGRAGPGPPKNQKRSGLNERASPNPEMPEWERRFYGEEENDTS